MPDLCISARQPDRWRRVVACLLAAAVPLGCLSGVATADDMSMKGMSMGNMSMASTSTAKPAAAGMPVKAPAAVYNWTGCYAGVNGGGGAAASDVATAVAPGSYLLTTDPATVSLDGSGSANMSTFLGGGQLGCNWQSGTLVVGVEGDLDYFHGKPNFYNNTDTLAAGTPFVVGQSLTTDYQASVRPRIGIGADRNLAYITGGVAFTAARYIESYADAAGGLGSATASKFLTGWTVGAGWQYAVTGHWLFRAEYLFAAFPKTTAVGVIVGPGGSNQLQGSADLVTQIARAGVDYKF